MRAPLKSAQRRFRLTSREVEVLELILRGYDAKAIASVLYIAETTVREHFKHLSSKIKAKNRAEMVARALDWREGASETASVQRA
jgi:DNA-binding NarL/FixJ family response regulator